MPHASLVESCLEDQARLTAVENFSKAHDSGALAADARVFETRYRELIPEVGPEAGEQYAFEVDLDRCTGCKACVTGCHNRNGLDEGETWRKIGSVTAGGPGQRFSQTVTTACHHCAEPGCLEGCPVLAYEKDPKTGIVVHLDDQCIGCQYCTMKCPYDVPQYDANRGIVRKCDMCIDRLVGGEAPACVQSCPNEAIRIVNVERPAAGAFEAAVTGFATVPGSPDVRYTLPTTLYKTGRPHVLLSETIEDGVVETQPTHLPLVLMLVLTQASVGVILAGRLLTGLWGGAQNGLATTTWVAVAAAALGISGLGAALLHLGRPRYAFRAVLGLRTSWLSREAVAFAVYIAMAMLHAVAAVATKGGIEPFGSTQWLVGATAWAALVTGGVGVGCSAMVYFDTPRPVWACARTPALFASTAVVMSLFTALLLCATTGTVAPTPLVTTAIAAIAAKIALELGVVAGSHASHWHHVRRVMQKRLGRLVTSRVVLGVSAAFAVAIGSATPSLTAATTYSTLALLLVTAGELAERYVFFASAPPSRMPGVSS